jgi:hypothetical protein
LQRSTQLCSVFFFLLLACACLNAQTGDNHGKDQEDFAIAVAKAHALTSPFGAGAAPFSIHATAVSSLALHGVGKGTYENQWVDSQHWKRTIRFPDFQQTEMRNDSGLYWFKRSPELLPIRVMQVLRFVVISLPGSKRVSAYAVSESAAVSDQGAPVTCYSATAAPRPDGFDRHYRWCFDSSSGLLASEDYPLNLHIAYGTYIPFRGKQVFTKVHVTASGIPVLDLDIQYELLDPHALDGLAPTEDMKRASNASSAPNSEEVDRGTVEYRYSPPLPAGTLEGAGNQPVVLEFYLGADNILHDASLERTPTQAMGEAALEAAKKFTFTPRTVNGVPVPNRFYESIWFQNGSTSGTVGNGDSSAGSLGGGSTLRDAGPARQTQQGIFRSDSPSFSFRYPGDFQLIPRGQLEADQHRTSDKPNVYGLDPHVACDTLLFRAQRLRPGERTPQVLSIIDLDPGCIFGMVDRTMLESVASNAINSVANHWQNARISKIRMFQLKGRVFAEASATGVAHGSIDEALNIVVVSTKIRDHVVGWTMIGPDNNLEETLATCLLQVGDEHENPLLPDLSGR